MPKIIASAGYQDGKIVECYSLTDIGRLQSVESLREITFYSGEAYEAFDYIFANFRNLPHRMTTDRKWITYRGELAQFIVENW